MSTPKEITENIPLEITDQQANGITRRRFLGIIGGGILGAIVYSTGIPQALLAQRERNTQRKDYLKSRSLEPESGQSADWWQELSSDQIKGFSTLPDMQELGERYISTVSPALQEKAQQAGYKLIFQGDPNDNIGRSAVTQGREINTEVNWTKQDLGFGRVWQGVRGILKAWVPDPDDPKQIKKVYALLENPLTKKQYIIGIDLSRFDPNRNTNLELPTFFAIDNLNYGPDYIKLKSDEAAAKGYVGSSGPITLSGSTVPDPDEDRSTRKRPWKTLGEDFPEFYQLLRVKGFNLSDIAKPGDFISIGLKGQVTSDNQLNLIKDEKGVTTAVTFLIRRFGGLQQWQSEVNHTP